MCWFCEPGKSVGALSCVGYSVPTHEDIPASVVSVENKAHPIDTQEEPGR